MRKKHIAYFTIGIVGIIIINILTQKYFFRIDLTEEKRYTISPATKKVLKNLDSEVYIKVYLTGKDLPAAFKRFQQAIAENLDEFQIYAGKKVKYRFIDPNNAKNDEERAKNYEELAKKGITPTNIFDTEEGKKVEKLIFPGAIIAYQGKETPILLLKSNQGATMAAPQEIINQSIENIEYELAVAIKKLSLKDKKKIAFIEGHGELSRLEIADIATSLTEYYEVKALNITQVPNLDFLDAIIIARPQTAFSEDEKYKIDQFVMNGGKALFFVDALGIHMDSIANKGTYSFAYNHNLTDLLFKYGVRINPNLIQDLNAGAIPMVVGNMGDQPQMQLVRWRYYPLLTNLSKHPIVKNLAAVYGKFVSTLDTVKADQIQKIPLLTTSPYTKVYGAPVYISLNEARIEPDPKKFREGSHTIAYLLEGKFTSLYKNRITSTDLRYKTFKNEGKPSKIIVCADGDILRNELNPRTKQPMPLGLDIYTKITFANKEFVINAVDYLLDEQGVILARAKEVILRPLDKLKVAEQRLNWQLFNLFVPILLLLMVGIVRNYWRKREYTLKQKN